MCLAQVAIYTVPHDTFISHFWLVEVVRHGGGHTRATVSTHRLNEIRVVSQGFLADERGSISPNSSA